MNRDQLQREAWVGDAILELYARLQILEEDQRVDGDKCRRMTSNQFLATMGDPTILEAELGRVYRDKGMEAAFHWIRLRLMLLFVRQEENRTKRPRKR